MQDKTIAKMCVLDKAVLHAYYPLQQEMVSLTREGNVVQQLEGVGEEEEEDDEDEDTEGGGMELHHSESSLELERVGGSSSSLSSGRLEESITLASENTAAGGRTDDSTALEELGLTLQTPIGGASSLATAEAQVAEPVFTNLLQTSLRGLGETSVDPDPEGSRHSSDSSNGTPRPGNILTDPTRLMESSRTSGFSGGSSLGASGSGQAPQQQQQQRQQESGDGNTSPTRATGEWG